MFSVQLYKRTLMSTENSLSNTEPAPRSERDSETLSLVEMSFYFDTILLPRIKKSVYSQHRKDGLKLMLASGELTTQKSALAEDYRFRVSLGSETSGSPNLLGKNFTNPNSYQLSIVRDGRRREVLADLCETFKYLIGLRVNSRLSIDGVLVFTGKDAKGYECSVLWCDIDAVNYVAPANWFKENKAKFGASLEIVYVNRDHTLNVIRGDYEVWSTKTLEPEFCRLMFAE